MSTKIYDAYICKLGFHYTHQVIQEIREDYETIVREYIKKVPYQLRNACIKHFANDVIVLYPILANGDILFQIFAHNSPYNPENCKTPTLPTIPLMIAFNKIQDYHYQNQADPWYTYEEPLLSPYDLAQAEKDYKQREKDWKEVFKEGLWTPAEVGYTIPLIKDKLLLEWDK